MKQNALDLKLTSTDNTSLNEIISNKKIVCFEQNALNELLFEII